MYSRIIKLGLGDRVAELVARGHNQRKIAALLSAETGKTISRHTVLRYLQRGREIARNEEAAVEAARTQIHSTYEEEERLYGEVKRDLVNSRDRGESPRRRASLYAVASKLLELKMKRLGELQGDDAAITQVTMNVIAPVMREDGKDEQH